MSITNATGIDYGAAAEKLRDEIRQWLDANAPESLKGVGIPRRAEGQVAVDLRAWAQKLGEAGLFCVSWPKEYGGRGCTAAEVAVIQEEFARVDMPRLTRGMGESLVGPSIIVHGTDEQRAYFLPRIIAGTDKYCQGFSEPGAGSDLASLITRGTVDGDEIVVSGQKVWTSWYWDATMLFCLCRTDPNASKHGGISYVLIPIDRADGSSNGVEFRPLRQLTGQSHFAETFLTEARAPLFNVIGGLNEGWRVAMTTLGSERGGHATTRHLAFLDQFWDVVAELKQRDKLNDPVIRQLMAWSYTHVELLRYQGLELLASIQSGNAEGSVGSSSLHKILWSEYQQRFAEQIMTLLGPESLIVGQEYSLTNWQQVFLTSRSDTIWGGTAQIQRNILAERALGLPKEPRN
jgi:alkylation response protein AidB-like acyl-CoA dehydrogenase